jgi:polysaccharide biosynthesis protein PslG
MTKISIRVFTLSLLLSSCTMSERVISSNAVSPALPKTAQHSLGVTITDLSDDTLNKAVQAGFKMIRADLQWGEVEQVKGRYDWSTYDGFIAGLQARGLRPMLILDFNNPLYNPNQDYMDPIDTPQEIEGFKNFAVAAVKRYQHLNPIWELYNEPNRPQFWRKPNPLEYINLVKATVPAMRQVNPGIYVIGPALGHDPNANPESIDKLDYAYLEQTLKAGLLRFVNAVSIHPYPDAEPEQAIGIYAKVNKLIDQYATASKPPIISSEWGYTSAAAISSDPQTHANYWSRMFLVNLSQKIPVSIGFKLEYSTLDPGLDEYELGFPLFDANGQAKLAYTQIQELSNILEGFSFIRRLSSARDDYLLKFSSPTKTLVIAWTTSADHEVKIDSKAYTLSGKPIFIRQ